MQDGRNTSHCFWISRNEGYERIIKSEQQEQAIEDVIDLSQIAILLFVQNHEPVVLFYKVVISPQRSYEEENEPGSGQHSQRSHHKKEQRAPQKPAAVLSLCAIEVCARESSEDVRRVDQYGPGCGHRHQRQHTADIQCQQRIS